jgi:hypothetical protein
MDALSGSQCKGKKQLIATKGDRTMEVTRIGLDLAKSVFQVHGVDAHSKVVIRKQLTRGKVLGYFAQLPRISLDWKRAGERTTGAGVTEAGARRTTDGGGDDPAL